MLTDAEHAARFAEQAPSTAQFWARFERQPSVGGRTVLDIGCGRGALCIDLAQRGAKVLGIDSNQERIAWAQRHLELHHPDLVQNVRFGVHDATSPLPSETFDLIVSKDTVEHVENVYEMFKNLKTLLAPDGELWLGFSPLYYSPFGDHRRTDLSVPWAHAVLPLGIVLRLTSWIKGRAIGSLSDLELNGLTPAEFRSAARVAGFDIQSISYNPGDRFLLRIMRRLRAVRWLEPFMTIGIYAVLVHHTGADPGRLKTQRSKRAVRLSASPRTPSACRAGSP